MLYNSAVFGTLNAYEYHVLVVDPLFLSTKSVNISQGITNPKIREIRESVQQIQDSHDLAGYEYLDREDCINAYTVGFVHDRKNVIAIAANTPANASLVYYYGSSSPSDHNPYEWVCRDAVLLMGETCPPSGLDPWILAGQRIDSCLSKKMEQECKLQIAVPVLVIVVLCNLVKTHHNVVAGLQISASAFGHHRGCSTIFP
jgi:hypothetical protein